VGVAEFRREVAALGLVAADQLARLDAAGDVADDAQRLASLLTAARKLTPYQAGAILQGKARGLRVGDYLVLDRLGAGGMGLVLKARRFEGGPEVALKLLPPSFGRDDDAVARFRREVEVASGLDHPNIVAAVDAGVDRGVHFLAMELIVGRDLDRIVASGGPMPTALAVHCLIQAARGLAAAHAGGVVHRDVKPSNLMLDASGAVRVLDLGLARVIESTSPLGRAAGGPLTDTGAYMGTVDFLAPEQAEDAKRADRRADVYSLGCTLYFLLTGNPPFGGDSVLKKLLAHQERPAPSLLVARPDAPPALESAYLAMMAKRPDDRPGSMDEVIRLLEAAGSRPDEGGTAVEDLLAFARTAMKRAGTKPYRSRDASVFDRPRKPVGVTFDPDLRLEDLVMDFRPETPPAELPEERLPPRRSVVEPPRLRRRRRATAPAAWFATLGTAAAIAWFAPWRGPAVDEAPPAALAPPVPEPEPEREMVGPPAPPVAPDPEISPAPKPAASAPRPAVTSETYGDRLVEAEEAGDWDGAERALGECPPDLRGWEWGYVRRRARASADPEGPRSGLRLQGRGASYFGSIAFSPDGRTVAAGSLDRSVKLWDPATRRVRTIGFAGERLTVCGVAFSPAGDVLAAATTHGVWLCDPAAAAPGRLLKDHAGCVNAVAFSPDGLGVATAGDDRTARIRRIEPGSPSRKLTHPDMVTDVAFSPDGLRLATSCVDGVVRLWNAEDGSLIRELKGHSEVVGALAYSPDGSRLATSSQDGTIILWGPDGRKEATLAPPAKPVERPAFSPDGRRLASSLENRSIVIWDVQAARKVLGIASKTGYNSLAFSPDGLRLAAVARDRPSLTVWEADPPTSD
jgi:serine/threonine protein kinase